MNSKKTKTELNSEELEQAVGGAATPRAFRAEINDLRNKMQGVSKDSNEYKNYDLQLTALKSEMDGLTSNNQLVMNGINSRIAKS